MKRCWRIYERLALKNTVSTPGTSQIPMGPEFGMGLEFGIPYFPRILDKSINMFKNVVYYIVKNTNNQTQTQFEQWTSG